MRATAERIGERRGAISSSVDSLVLVARGKRGNGMVLRYDDSVLRRDSTPENAEKRVSVGRYTEARIDLAVHSQKRGVWCCCLESRVF